MAFPAANVGFRHIPLGLFTIGRNLYPPLEKRVDRSGDSGIQLEKFTGVGAADTRHRTGPAQVGCPALTGHLE